MASRDAWLELRGARLRVRDEGSGPAVLLVHGWPLDLDVWEPQVPALVSQYQVIRFDRRGFGLSSGEPSLGDDVADLLALLDRFELDRVTLVAASQGARVALRVALVAPHRVASLVLDGPPDEVTEGAGSLTSKEIPLDEYRELAQRGDIAAVRRASSRHPLMRLSTKDATIHARLDEILARYPGRDLLAPILSRPISLGRQLSSISTPALIINGDHDSAVRLASGALLASTLRAATRALVPDAGHLANLDQPSFYNALLIQFIKESLDARP